MSPNQPRTSWGQSPDDSVDQSDDSLSESSFPIIGVGASAGGLEAITELFRHLPSNSGMAFVLVQHLDPKRESILTSLLSKMTKMPVQEVKEGMVLAPNSIYVIPPAMDITIVNGKLALQPRPSSLSRQHMPIDLFFRSLADKQGANAVGVVLSGTGSDGALGLTEIHSKGGITIAQDPSSAKFEAMPRNAISTGCVNYILPPEKIADELVRIGHHPLVKDHFLVKHETVQLSPQGGEINKIFGFLKTKTGVDFSLYKRSTLERRISRRMVLQKVNNLWDYLVFLKENAVEVDSLYHDILIKVTRFFRDPKTFEILTSKVFGEITRDKAPEAPIRLWIPGCATGEEVYSLAICLLEFLGEKASHTPIQIFGSDLSELALEKARSATYLENIAQDVSPERLQRFFNKVNKNYQVSKSIRDLCIFAKQNLVVDPPFSKLDLISCRNVLIYLNPELQKKVFPIFHFSLNPNGWLLLGSAETVGSFSDLFTTVNHTHRIFSKNLNVTPRIDFELKSGSTVEIYDKSSKTRTDAEIHFGRINIQKEADRIFLDRYAPVGVVVNTNLEIVHFRGDTNPYFYNPSGEASHKLLKMAREGLASELNSAIQKAKSTNAPYRKKGLQVKYNGRVKKVILEVIPIPLPLSQEHYWGIMFKEQIPIDLGFNKPTPIAFERKSKIDENRWRRELDSTKAYLESVIEEKDAALEELQSANEEVLSSNEELQSINEEMQTAKEELQSTNEELTTINDELHHSNQQSLQLVNDLNNLLDSVNIPIVMVGGDYKIRRFTPPAEKLLHLIPSDLGRPIGDINTRFLAVDFEKIISETINNLSVKELQVQDGERRWHSIRIHPYKTMDQKIDGALIALIDVETMKQTEISITKARDTAEDILATLREPLVVLDSNLSVTRANPSFYRTFHTTAEETEGKNIFSLGNGQWNIPRFRILLEEIVHKNNPILDFEIENEFPTIGQKSMILNARKIISKQKEDLILLAIEDITERKRAVRELAKKANDLSQINKNLEDFSHIVSHDLKSPLRAIGSYAGLIKIKPKATLDEESLDYLDRIQKGVHKMGQLIDSLLTYSKTTMSEHKLEPVDLNTVVKEVLEELKLEIKELNATIIVGNLPTVKASRILEHQLVYNLVGNALKYSGRETPQIKISAKREEDWWVVSVEDNGIGIDPLDIKRIFNLFERVGGEDKPGTGIGLTLCKKIVEGHGGQIWVDSKPGHGSTFHFTLPV